jgi:hypothetical protein
MPQQENPNGWHLDRRLHLVHIITSAGLIVTCTLYLAEMRKDIELLKQQQQVQVSRDNRQDTDLAEGQRVIRERLDRMEDLLLRVLEYQRNGSPKR